MTIAELALRAVVRRRLARVAILRDDKAFEALQAALQVAMANTFSEAMRKGITVALDRLRDMGPGQFTRDDAGRIMAALETEVGADALKAAMREPIVNLSDSLYRLGQAEVGAAAGASIAFGRADQDALDVLARASNFWVGDMWSTGPRTKIEAVLTDYLNAKLTRDSMARRLAEDFAGVSDNSLHHWKSVAHSLATRTREIGRVSAYERAAITHVRIKAVLDDRTTTICRHLNGRVLEVPALRQQAEDWIAASNKGNRHAAFAAWPFHADTEDFSATPTSALPGVGLPPYHHGNCRTTTVAYFGDRPGDLGQWRRAMQDRDQLPKAEVAKIIDRAKAATWAEGATGTVAKSHFFKHGRMIGSTTLGQYNDSIADNIRRAGREVWLFQREENMRVLFVRPMSRISSKGKTKAGLLVTTIDLEANRIVSHHWRDKLGSDDVVVPVRQGGASIVKRVMAWLTS